MANTDKEPGYLIRFWRFIEFRIIHIDDSPHRIALGVSLGMFTAFLPFLGLHSIIALLLAFLARANKAVALLCSWISNPFTVIPIFIPCYLLGRAVIGVFTNIPMTGKTEVAATLRHTLSYSSLSAEFWKEMGSLFGKIGLELVTGSLICGVTTAFVSYFVMFNIIVVHRAKRKKQIALQ